MPVPLGEAVGEAVGVALPVAEAVAVAEGGIKVTKYVTVRVDTSSGGGKVCAYVIACEKFQSE